MATLEKFIYYSKVVFAMQMKRVVTSYQPEYIGLEVTNVCNFKCAFCPQSAPEHHNIVPKSYLTEEHCEIFLKKIRDAGIRTNLMHWTLDGEPFMHKGFASLCRIAVKYGFSNSYFATNGTFLTPERLLEFPTDSFHMNLSIDFCADKEYFESVRGKKGSWKIIRDNIATIVSDDRLKHVRIDVADISPYSIQDPVLLEEKHKQLVSTFPTSPRLRFDKKTFHNSAGLVKKYGGKTGRKYHLCPYPWTTLRIASNGDIVACCRDLRHQTVLGNLLEQEVPEIWNGELMQTLRRNLVNKEPNKSGACAGCDLPYDSSKFTFRNKLKAAKRRMQLFSN